MHTNKLNNNFDKIIRTYKDKIIDFILDNKYLYINVIEKFNNNFSLIPESVGFYPFIKNNSIESLIAFIESGYYYPVVNEKNIDKAAEYISSSGNIFSIYGYHETINPLINLINKPVRYINKYFSMKLRNNDFNPVVFDIDNYYCSKCDITYFDKLKDIQYLYHKEEVYDSGSYYPYKAEMRALKETLATRLNYAVFLKEKNNAAVSKCNVNGEAPNLYQLGGIYTKKEYRNKGFSKLCLTYLINDIFNLNKNNEIILYVKKENEAAVNLYLKLGFKIEYETMLCYY